MQATPVDRPRFRQDLVAEPIEDGGARFIDVMDPDSGTLFRFYEVEYSLACGMDGQRDVAGIVKWAEDELGLKASPKEVNHVISTLGELGYLERGAAAAAAATAAAAAAATPPAMGDADLERGVVHAKSRPSTPVPEVELGGAGTRPSQGELPRAPELELGAPGTTAPARPAAAKVDDIPLGKPGRTEKVDVDLAAEMPVSAAAVKEAVRQSQVMKSVDVPPELAAELEKPAKVEAKPEPRVEAKPAAKPEPAQKPAEAKPAQKPAEKPAQKPVEAKPVTPQPPPASGSPISPVLIAALVLVFLGLGGLALWKFVFAKKDTPQTTGQVENTPPPQPEPPPPPPPVETAKLALEQPAAEEVKPVAPGRVATIVANDTAVKEGDAIARLDGYKPVEAQVTSIDKAIAKAKDAAASAEKERDAAQTAGNKNGVTSAEKKLAAAQKTLTEQEAKLATAKAALDKFLIKAPAAGKVTAVAKARAKVTPTDVIATLTPEPVLVATFKSAGEVAVGTRVLLGLAGSDQQLSCGVVQSGGDGVKVSCTKDAATEGAEVTYAGVDPNAPAPDAPPPGDTPANPEAGSAEPAAGSDAEDAKPDEPEEPKVEEKKAEKKPARPRPRPRPRRPRPPADQPEDKPAGSGDAAATGSSTGANGGSDKAPADKPADPPPAPPAAPGGSGTP